MEFLFLGDRRSTVSSIAEVPIIDNLISEPTESFICVILRSRGEDGIIVEYPNTIIVVIEDDDCKYSSVLWTMLSIFYRVDYLSWVLLHKGKSHHAFIHHDWEGYHQMG